MSTAMKYPTANVASTDRQCLEEISGRASDVSQFQGWEQSLEGGLPARWLPKPWGNLPEILLVSATMLPRSARWAVEFRREESQSPLQPTSGPARRRHRCRPA